MIQVRAVAMLVCAVSLVWAGSPDMAQARKLYNLTEFEQSLKVLHAIPDKDGPVYDLMGRNYYLQADYKKASEALEKAVAADPGNSEYALWLARALGRRAETSSPFTAPGFASKARQYFEKAAQLNPRNLEALSDLFEYYLEAPGFLGGGQEKAQAVAKQIAMIDPGEGHWSQAKLAKSARSTRARRSNYAAPSTFPPGWGASLNLPVSSPNRAASRSPTRAWHAPKRLPPTAPG